MTTNNNTLVHKYLVPLIENIDFDGCENNSNIKAVISKLMTISKNTMKNQEEPGDTTGFKIDEMRGVHLSLIRRLIRKSRLRRNLIRVIKTKMNLQMIPVITLQKN
jgi:hypothetical protein